MSTPHNFWRLTLDTNPEDCNLHCIMCEEHSPYSDFIPKLYEKQGVKRPRRMPYEWIERLITEAAALGAREIIPWLMERSCSTCSIGSGREERKPHRMTAAESLSDSEGHTTSSSWPA